MENSKTRAWELYELGRNYNESLTPDQYTLVDTNTEFFIGNQWLRLPRTAEMCALPKPVFNILKRVASMFIASLTSSATTIHFDPLAYYDGSNIADPDHDAADYANAAVEALLEKFKFDYRIRDALFDGAVCGDYCAHFWFDPDALPYGGAFAGKGDAARGEIQMELVDGINVMFGNPNERSVEKQPYILIVGRDTVEHLRAEAERFKANRTRYPGGTANDASGELLAAQLQPDSEYDKMPGVGGKTEIIESEKGSGKALFVYMYSRVERDEDVTGPDGEPVRDPETGKTVTRRVSSIHVTKATKTAVIYEDVDTGLALYPIAWGNWEKQKNQYHGRALVTGLIPNQIFINSMFATAMRHLQLMAFPKTIFNGDLISRWDNEIGKAIAVRGLMPGQDVGQVASVLQPAEVSGQIFTLIDKVMEYTKDCLGATDAQMGNVKPDNTSALMVLQTSAEVPLENIRSGLYEWVEDCGRIMLDMIGTYYGLRPVVVEKEFEEPVTGPDGMPLIDPMTGVMRTRTYKHKAVEEFDFSQFKRLWLNLRADVGATTYFSEIAMTQTLDNLRADGTLGIIEYLERLPDKLLPKKQELLDTLRDQVAQQMPEDAGAGGMAYGAPAQGGTGGPGAAAPVQGGELDAARQVQGLPQSIQAQYGALPGAAQKTARQQGNMRL